MGRARAGDAATVYALVVAVAALSWIAFWSAQRSPYGRYMEHEASGGSVDPLAAIPIFLLGWTVMVTATVVPTTVPLLTAFHRVVRRRPQRGRLVVVLGTGFLGVWVACGYLAWAADSLVHATVDSLPWLADRPQLIAGGALVAAGAYQLTALKQRCVDLCRSPRSVLLRHWGGDGSANRQALSVGIAYGLSCLGCCWPLMLLMFAFGLGSVAWMVVLAAVMAIEKNAPLGPRLTRPLGIVLLAAGGGLTIAG